MHDGVQARERRRIAEDDGAQALAVDRAVGADDVRSERGHHLVEPDRPRRVDIVADAVGVDHRRPELGEHPNGAALAGADAAGHADRCESAESRAHPPVGLVTEKSGVAHDA
jgi:hypothetical protein